jgi:hypothetical protein
VRVCAIAGLAAAVGSACIVRSNRSVPSRIKIVTRPSHTVLLAQLLPFTGHDAKSRNEEMPRSSPPHAEAGRGTVCLSGGHKNSS